MNNQNYLPNICLDVRYLTKNLSGVGRYIKNLTESMLATFHKEANFFLLGDTDNFNQLDLEESMFTPIITPFKATTHPLHDLWYNVKFPEILRKHKEILRKHKINLFHATAFMVPFVKLPCPLVTTICDRVAKAYPATLPFFFRTFLNINVSMAIKRSTQIIAISNFTKKEIEKEFKIVAPIKVIHLGCYNKKLPLPSEKIKQLASYILVVGNIEPRKGIEELLKGYLLYRTLHPEKQEKIIFAGQTLFNYTKPQEIRAKSIFKESIIFTGYLQEQELIDYYAGSKLNIIPSLYEGFGLTVLESMRANAPVLINDIEVLNEVGGELIDKVDIKDPEKIEKQLFSLLQIKKNNTFTASSYENHLKNFTWEKCALNTFETYGKNII